MPIYWTESQVCGTTKINKGISRDLEREDENITTEQLFFCRKMIFWSKFGSGDDQYNSRVKTGELGKERVKNLGGNKEVHLYNRTQHIQQKCGQGQLAPEILFCT